MSFSSSLLSLTEQVIFAKILRGRSCIGDAPFILINIFARKHIMTTVETAACSSVLYQRHRRYRDMTPLFETMMESSEIRPPEVNLCDYWDYLDGILLEACRAERLGTIPPLRRLSIFITERCNLRCSYCIQEVETDRTIDKGWLVDSLAEARSMGAVILDIMGLGEPTLIDELPDIAVAAAQSGLVVTIGTNGCTDNLSNPRFRSRLFEASPLKFRVSLDSADAAEQDRAGGQKGAWRKTVDFLTSLLSLRETGALKAGVFINKIVSRDNVEHLMRDLKWMAGMGIDDIHLMPVRFHEAQYLTAAQISRYNKETAPQVAEMGERFRLPWLRENAFIFGTTKEETALASQGQYYRPAIDAYKCFVQKGQLLLDPHHRIWTCLWSRRNGGVPLRTGQWSSLADARREALKKNYLEAAPEICRNHCTKWIIEANNRAAGAMKRMI